MTQNVVSFCRLNTSMPNEIIYKVVGAEIVKQIHDKALEELRGERRSKVKEVVKYMKEAENADKMIRSKMRRTLLRKALSPVEMAWAYVYACTTEWPKAAYGSLCAHLKGAKDAGDVLIGLGLWSGILMEVTE